ncbi:MAG: cell division protein ZapA [Rikenellaceae bacterium]
MMEQKRAISITIAGKEYPFVVEPSKSELFKLAERKVNNAILKLEKRGIADYSRNDLVALAALDLALTNIKLKQRTEVENEDIVKLVELNQKIDSCLNE